MKVKILKNVIVGQKVYKKEQVVDVTDRKVSSVLLQGEYAEEHQGDGAAEQQKQQPPKS